MVARATNAPAAMAAGFLGSPHPDRITLSYLFGSQPPDPLVNPRFHSGTQADHVASKAIYTKKPEPH